jgi:hypothetical protein
MATASDILSKNGEGGAGPFNLRTILLVTVVSLLVWLLAESRTVRSETVELTPSLEIGPGGAVLTRAALGTEWPDSLTVTFSGSTAGLDQAIRSFRGRVTMRVGIEVPAAPGVHEIDLREMLRASQIADEAGVTVEEVDPPRLTIQVDAVREIEIPIRVLVPEGVAYEPNGVARATPGTVKIVGPEAVVARLAEAEATVRLDASAVAGMLPGRASTVGGLRVELPPDEDRWATRIDPAQANVTMTLRSRTAELTLSAMPIQVMIAPGEVGRWSIEIAAGSEDLVGVQVVGPSDQIARLRSGEVVPTAFLSLGFDELERGIETKSVLVHGLPAGVTLLSGQSLEVGFRVTRRDALSPEE